MSAHSEQGRTKMTKEEWDQLTEHEQQAWLDSCGIYAHWKGGTYTHMQSNLRTREVLWKREAIARLMKGVSPLDYDP